MNPPEDSLFSHNGMMRVSSEQLKEMAAQVKAQEALREEQKLGVRIQDSISLDRVSIGTIKTLILKYLNSEMTLKRESLRSRSLSSDDKAFPVFATEEEVLKNHIREKVPLKPWDALQELFEENIQLVIEQLEANHIIDRSINPPEPNLIIYPSLTRSDINSSGGQGSERGLERERSLIKDLSASPKKLSAQSPEKIEEAPLADTSAVVKLNEDETKLLTLITESIKEQMNKTSVSLKLVKEEYLGISSNIKVKNMNEEQKKKNTQFGNFLQSLQNKGFISLDFDNKTRGKQPELFISLTEKPTDS